MLFLLGRYYNRLYESEKLKAKEGSIKTLTHSTVNLAYLVCKQYGKSLLHGTKYLYQSLPRLLTLWLDTGASLSKNESTSQEQDSKLLEKLGQMNQLVAKLITKLPSYVFLTAMPQLISRICHPNAEVQEILEAIIVSVLSLHPQQTLWHLIPVAKSTIKSRVQRVASIFGKIKSDHSMRNQDPKILQKIQVLNIE